MANCINYDCNEELGTHLPNDCGEELLGGVSAIVLLECNSLLTDPSSATQINTELSAGRAHIITNTKVGIPDPSPIEVDSNVSCGSQVLVNYDRTFTLIDGNISINNVNFYNNIFAGRVFGGAILYICGTSEADSGEKVLWINPNKGITARGGMPVPDSNNSFMTFSGTFKWRQKKMPLMYAAPVGIF